MGEIVKTEANTADAMRLDKVTVIGYQSSGKTAYLIGMYNIMSMGIENFTLLENNLEIDLHLGNLWRDIAKEGIWPQPTDQSERYSFSLSKNFERLVDFDWLDYPGDILVSPARVDELKDFINRLAESVCLFVIVSGDSFAFSNGNRQDGPIMPVGTAETSDNIEAYKQLVNENMLANGDLVANRRLLRAAQQLGSLPPVCVIVTKADLIPCDWMFRQINDIIKTGFSALLGVDRTVMTCAVSVYDEELHKGRFINVEQPIIFAVLAILKNYIEAATALRIDTVNTLQQSDTTFGRLFNRKRLEALRQQIEKIEGICKKYKKDIYSLLDVFPDDKKIFKGQDMIGLREYYEDFLSLLEEV